MRIALVFIMYLLSVSRMQGQEIKEKYLLRGIKENASYSVRVHEDVINEITTLSSDVDTLTISGVQDIKTVMVLSEAFLEMQFRIRGGSGVKVRRTMLLCISQGKIYKALDVLSEVTSRVSEVYDRVADSLRLFDEKEDYQIIVSIKQTEGNPYSAILFEKIKIESKYNPTQNLSHDKPYELQFDPNGLFFYNSTKRLYKHYRIYSSRNNKTVDKFVSLDVPCIQLYDKCYLLIDHEWCLDNGNDSLTCL